MQTALQIEPTRRTVESERLASLHEIGLCGSEPTDTFDRICETAATCLNVPIAIISFVGETEAYFKAKVGVSIDHIPRADSFCDYVIRGDDTLVIPDALHDERFRRLPVVAGAPGVRFYAGTPIGVSPGLRIGSLCVLDTIPRKLAPREMQVLQSFGKWITTELRLILATRRMMRSGRP